jgi:hypothetical protein
MHFWRAFAGENFGDSLHPSFSHGKKIIHPLRNFAHSLSKSPGILQMRSRLPNEVSLFLTRRRMSMRADFAGKTPAAA